MKKNLIEFETVLNFCFGALIEIKKLIEAAILLNAISHPSVMNFILTR